jgi:hypothetical protein
VSSGSDFVSLDFSFQPLAASLAAGFCSPLVILVCGSVSAHSFPDRSPKGSARFSAAVFLRRFPLERCLLRSQFRCRGCIIGLRSPVLVLAGLVRPA